MHGFYGRLMGRHSTQDHRAYARPQNGQQWSIRDVTGYTIRSGSLRGAYSSHAFWQCASMVGAARPFTIPDVDATLAGGPELNLSTNLMLMWGEPGNIGTNLSRFVWTRPGQPAALSYLGYVGPKSSRDDVGLTIAQDMQVLYISGPDAGFAFANHEANQGVRAPQTFLSGTITNHLMQVGIVAAANAATFQQQGRGGNIVYNDGHVEFKRPSELFSVTYGGSSLYFMDLPQSMR